MTRILGNSSFTFGSENGYVITLSKLKEGLRGDYDPDDPNDMELLHVDLYVYDKAIDCYDLLLSDCTVLPVTTSLERREELVTKWLKGIPEALERGNLEYTFAR